MRCRQRVSVYAALILSSLFLSSRLFAGDLYASCSGCAVGGPCTVADARSGTVVAALGSISGPFCHVVGTPFMGGSAPTPVGVATVNVDGSNNVVISNIGASGSDGARFPLTSTTGFGVFTPTLPDLKTAGQILRTSLRGRVNGLNDQLIGQNTIQGTGATAVLSVDYSGIGSTTSSVSLFRSNGTLVATFTVPNNSQLTIFGSYMDFNRSISQTTAVSLLGAEDIEVGNFGFTTDVSVQGPAPPAHPGVRTIVVKALNITATREGVSAFTVQAANVSSITIPTGVLGGGVQSVTIIPSLTEWGMVALAVMLLASAMIFLMFRSRELSRVSQLRE